MGADKTLTFEVTVQHPDVDTVQDTATVTVAVTGQFTNFNKTSSKLLMFYKLNFFVTKPISILNLPKSTKPEQTLSISTSFREQSLQKFKLILVDPTYFP